MLYNVPDRKAYHIDYNMSPGTTVLMKQQPYIGVEEGVFEVTLLSICKLNRL